jgi:hypothetical protein
MCYSAAAASRCDGCNKQFSAESTVGKMGGDRFSRLLRDGLWIKEKDDGRASTAKGYPQDARFACQFLQTRKQRAQRSSIRLVDPVLKRRSEQVVTALGEGSEQQHGILNVRDDVCTRVLRGEHATGVFSS